MMRRSSLVLVFLGAAISASSSGAAPLPGILERQVIHEARLEARQQKRDAQSAVISQARRLGYSPDQIQRALTPTMVRHWRTDVTLRDGTVIRFPCYRIGFAENELANWHKPIARDAQGKPLRRETNKGGVRLHFGVFFSEVYALALKMDTKLATAGDAIDGEAMRGAKGGIGHGLVIKVGTEFQAQVGDLVDGGSRALGALLVDGARDRTVREAIMQGYGKGYRLVGGDVGPFKDIQAGDVNTKAFEMKVLARTYGSARKLSWGVSGKEVIERNGVIDPRGGIQYRGISTGEGVWMAVRLAARREGVKIRGATVAAQGWGEVGDAFGKAALRDGARVIAIQELWNVGGERVEGVLLNPVAQPTLQQSKRWVAEVEAFKASGEDIQTYQGGRLFRHFRQGWDVSQVQADIVGVNALGGKLNPDTIPDYLKSGTHQGKRKILAEGANLAETAEGARLLDQHRGKLLTITGDLANLGGVHVSDLEAVQNLHGKAVTSARARRSLQGTIRAGWNRAMKLADRLDISERQAIELAAVDGMMKRSLHLKGAPRASLEQRVFGKQLLQAAPVK